MDSFASNFLFKILAVLVHIGGMNQTQREGILKTSAGDIITLTPANALSRRDFDKIHFGLKNASIRLPESNQCEVMLCGYSTFRSANGSDLCMIEPLFNGCLSYYHTQIINEDNFIASSISMACYENSNPMSMCDAACREKQSSLESDVFGEGWKDNECAALYSTKDCEDCYFEGIRLKSDETMASSHNRQFNSLIVRRNCTLTLEIPGYNNWCEYMKDPREYYFNGNEDNFTSKSAYLVDFPEHFSCTCGSNDISTVSPATTTIIASTEAFDSTSIVDFWSTTEFADFSSTTELPDSSTTELPDSSTTELVDFSSTTEVLSDPTSMKTYSTKDDFTSTFDISPTTDSPNPTIFSSSTNFPVTTTTNFPFTTADQALWLKILLGIVSVCLIASITVSIGLFISKRRQTVRFKSICDLDRDLDISTEYNNVECPIELSCKTSCTNFAVNSAFEICSESVLQEVESLGVGHFGEVRLGSLQVAIKTARKNTTHETLSLRSLQHEIKILIHLGTHENVIRFIGTTVSPTENGEICLITEYCKNGSLKDYLIKTIKPHIESLIRCQMLKAFQLADDGYPETTYFSDDRELTLNKENLSRDLEDLDSVTLTRFLQWSGEIANGMEYITLKRVVHVDLAARNVLLTHNLTTKIGDFGLAKKIYVKQYVNSNKDSFPLLWVAPESLTQGKYSSKSDIWAYGVTLWEMFSLGKDPYEEMSSMEEILAAIIQGKGLNRAEFAPDYVHCKLTECWKESPEDRPSFQTLKQYFVMKRRQFEKHLYDS